MHFTVLMSFWRNPLVWAIIASFVVAGIVIFFEIQKKKQKEKDIENYLHELAHPNEETI